MKKQVLCVAAAMLLTTMPTLAQSNNNVDEVVKIERHASREFRQGEMIVKFKANTPMRVSAIGKKLTSGINSIDKVFSELGISKGEQLMPLIGGQKVNRTKALKSITGQPIPDMDMTLLYRLQFDPKQTDVFQAIERIKSLTEVEYAEPNYMVYSLSTNDEVTGNEIFSDPLCGEQWGHGQLKLNFLWKQKTISDKRPVIAILDTGVDIEHPDLKDNIWTNLAESEGAEGEDDDNNGFKDDLHGWDFVNQTSRLGDWNGHGTHCAGIAAAVGNNKIGITGANPDALIMPITVMQSDGTGDVATIIKGIDYAAANGANVISMSIGGYGYSLAEEQALAKAYSKAVLVAAAGNDKKCIYPHLCPVNKSMSNGPMYPAAFSFVLGVEASTQNGGLASFSNFDEDGPILSTYEEERLYNYELRAPGAAIMSTFPGGKYKKLNGTSMACPYVAGGVSRLLQCKEYSNWEILFGDLIHTRKLNGFGDVNFEAAYNITDEDRRPSLNLVTYILKDTIEGDSDGIADAGETVAIYPTFRNEWGQAQNIRFSLELAENEDPTIVEILDHNADFGKSLSSYGKNISANPIRFKVNSNCADGRKICMVLRATCDNIAEELVQKIVLTAENGMVLSGVLTEDMTLYPEIKYIIKGNFCIQEGTVLTIMPGSILEFNGGSSTLFPKGTLKCIGEPGNMIVFKMHNLEDWIDLSINSDTIEYVKLLGLAFNKNTINSKHCIFENTEVQGGASFLGMGVFIKSNIINTSRNSYATVGIKSPELINSNFITNSFNLQNSDRYGWIKFISSNIFGNIGFLSNETNGISNKYYNLGYYSSSPKKYTPASPNYLGSADMNIIRNGLLDMSAPEGKGFGIYDISNTLTRPSAEAHGIVWKVVVNGYDAQDEFEQLPPLGVGKHKFEVYFNRPMDVSVAPMIAMGVRSPYTSHTIAEDTGWSADSLVYTAYLTIDGKTGADGLNRIYVSGARDNEYFDIPVENMRFNVQVEAAGSMATGLMAEAGLGKVTLTWETDEEDFADLLGYNIYRYTMNETGVSSDSIIINTSVLDSDETTFTDYDVVPGTTYYYVIKQLTTSLTSHALSNAVAATPLTAQKGDANGSMNVDIADVVTEVAYITYQNPQPFIFEAADVNNDEKVNVLDVVGTIGIITTPTETGINGMDEEPVRYFVKDGVLYMENTQALGGVQVRLNVEQGTEIKVLEALKNMEQTSTWTGENEYLFLAYSMSGLTLEPGTHALLQIGNKAIVTEVILSDAKGQNILAINDNTTGLGKLEAMQLQIPTPNPFTTVLHVPYVIGKEGSHKVSLVFTDMAGRTLSTYHTTNNKGSYTYTWHPKGLNTGLYLVSMYVDGKLMQSAKVICAGK